MLFFYTGNSMLYKIEQGMIFVHYCCLVIGCAFPSLVDVFGGRGVVVNSGGSGDQ